MNKNNAHLFLPLVQALADGNDIQINTAADHWSDMEDTYFSDSPELYRIKPKPLEVKLWVNDKMNTPDGVSTFEVGTANGTSTVRLFREVL